MQRHSFLLRLSALAAAICASAALSQGYPEKSLRIVTNPPGGGSDFAARLIAQGLTASLGKPVIVDNRTGAVLVETVVKAPPDGHTLLFYGSTIWLTPFLRDNVSYDVIRDFSPIMMAVQAPNVLVAHPSVAANSVKELIALAKARPGTLNYASVGSGSTSHLAAELFKAMAGVNLVQIPYKSSGPALTDLIGGQVQLMFSTAGGVTPHVKSGRLHSLAVTSRQPSELFPGLPTVAASGLPGYESSTIHSLFAPAGTPAAIIMRLNRDAVDVLKSPDVKDKLFVGGLEVVASTPAQLAATIKSETARMGKVIRDAGIRAD